MKFCDKISAYYIENKRDLPWRKTKDPYKIWLSEIIMQQTQISQGTAYYYKFVETYPTVFDLAKAGEQDILILWQGLGYYSRARNLHHTAKEIVRKYAGQFPDNFQDLIKLKGIGEYTASAILSICFNKPYPAVDGNVLRVISRLYNISEPVNQTSGKKLITEKCEKLICKKNPGDFNQALMDFGATQCTSSAPNCENCIFNNDCEAYRTGKVNNLPIKIKAKRKIKEYYQYFIIIYDNEILIKKRTEGIWKNLYEFPLIVNSKKHSKKKISEQFARQHNINPRLVIPDVADTFKHVLSHKILFVTFYLVKSGKKTDFEAIIRTENYKKIKISELANFPLPQVIRNFLSDKVL